MIQAAQPTAQHFWAHTSSPPCSSLFFSGYFPPAPRAASFGSWWFPDSPWLQLGTHLPPPQALSPGPRARQAPGGEGALDEHPLLLHPEFPLLPPLTPPPMLPLMMEVGLEGVSEIIYTHTHTQCSVSYKNITITLKNYFDSILMRAFSKKENL